MKALLLTVALATTAFAQGPGYPVYVKPKKPAPTQVSVPAVNPENPSTFMPKGTLYEAPGGQIRKVTGPGQSINAGTSLGRSTYSREPGSGPPQATAGSRLKTSSIKRTPLPGGSYPGQQP